MGSEALSAFLQMCNAALNNELPNLSLKQLLDKLGVAEYKDALDWKVGP